MRKHQQTQLLELIETLKEANTEIRHLMTSGEIQAMVDLMSDCQETVVQIGEFIEQLEGEGTKTVSYLEQYHELLYKACIRFVDSGIDEDTRKELQSGLTSIEYSIRTELKPNKVEILFLPYKASMWDSMESIWLAAKDDPQCDAVVVPIPYYDKLPDGTFGEMHYEGSQYPDYVPVVDWQKYDIENGHPDIIIVHNPYDNGNFVTSVHPLFYCKKLKDLTDLLVYVPYFVCVDDVQEHLCVNAGTLFADRVIVQSEKIRQTYIQTYRRFENKNNCRDRFGKAETKFVALGSPKFDKVINTSRENCKIPDEWRKLIEKPDGTRKKVILYNTSIGGLLEGDKKVLDKIRCVLDCFRSRNDAVLLWRPHPLNVTTYQSMRPQLLEDYLGIIAEYRKQEFGIYDDTPDLNRAIAISDAYYGDWGSLVALYQCTGKPVMIQDVDVVPQNVSLYTLAFENLVEAQGNFWFTSYDFNALFKMDMQTWKAEFVGVFTDENPNGSRLYSCITSHEGKLYFAPLSAKEIAKYDPEQGSFEKISLREPQGNIKSKYWPGFKFSTAVQYKNYVFFVPCSYPAIVRLDTSTDQLDYFSDWLDELERLTTDFNDVYFWHKAVVIGSSLITAACNSNAVLVFDMETGASTVREIGDKANRFSDICYDGSDFWLSPRNEGPIVKWNMESNKWVEFGEFPEGYVSGKLSFNDIIYLDGYVWLFPYRANKALKVGIQDGKIVVAEEFQQPIDTNAGDPMKYGGNYISAWKQGRALYAHTGKKVVCVDRLNGINRQEIVLPSLEAIKALSSYSLINTRNSFNDCKTVYDCIYFETAYSGLERLIYHILHRSESEESLAEDAQIELFRRTNAMAEGDSGSGILSYCKQMILY